MQKGSVLTFILIGILLIGVLVGGAYYLDSRNKIVPQSPSPIPFVLPSPSSQSQSDETANWKTYTDSTQSISFKYPSDWKLDPNNVQIPGIASLRLSTPLDGCMGDCPTFGITFQMRSTKESSVDQAIENDYKGNRTNYPNNPFRITDFTNSNNVQFKKVEADFPGSSLSVLYTLHNEHIYTISISNGLNGVTDPNDPDLKLFDQILSTFKFTPASPAGGDQTPSPSIGPRVAKPEGMCGGIAGIHCPSGYTCKYEGDFPDAAGTCVK